MIYSYTAFRDKDLLCDDIDMTPGEINSLDSVYMMTAYADPCGTYNIGQVMDNISKCMYELGNFPFKYMMKEFTTITPMGLSSEMDILHVVYKISDFDNSDEDERTLTISMFNDYKRVFSYRIKLEHAYQLYYNLDNISTDNVNLYVIPVYLNFNSDVGHRFIRISDYYYQYNQDVTNDGLKNVLIAIRNSLKEFFVIQMVLYQKLNNDEKPTTTSNKNTSVSHKTYDIFGDPIVYILKNTIMFQFKPTNKNIYDGNDPRILHTIDSYRGHVSSYYRMQWFGSRKNGTRCQKQILVSGYDRRKYNRQRKGRKKGMNK